MVGNPTVLNLAPEVGVAEVDTEAERQTSRSMSRSRVGVGMWVGVGGCKLFLEGLVHKEVLEAYFPLHEMSRKEQVKLTDVGKYPWPKQ